MNRTAEIKALRKKLDRLAGAADDQLMKRYAMGRPRLPSGLYWQLRWFASLILRWLESMRVLRPDPWPASLKQAQTNASARPILIWAIGTDRDTLREACSGFGKLQDSFPDLAPVLVTDLADFTFFSRLGWLVEYLPRLAGEGEAYEDRKVRFLARLYSEAPTLPASMGLEPESWGKAIRRWELRAGGKERTGCW